MTSHSVTGPKEKDAMITYKLVDGEPIGDFSWVTSLEFFDDEAEPVELIEEVWQRVGVRTFWHLPDVFYDCDVDWCDEDSTAWFEQAPGNWSRRCPAHMKVEVE